MNDGPIFNIPVLQILRLSQEALIYHHNILTECITRAFESFAL